MHEPVNTVIHMAAEQCDVHASPWTVIFGGIFLFFGCGLSVLLPFGTHMCFLDVACIYQGQGEMFERGLYGLGGCLSVSKELRVLYSPPYLSSLWCLFELVGFRKANPGGRLTFAPLFVERCVVICTILAWFNAIATDVMLALSESASRQRYIGLWYVAIFFPSLTLMVHAMRHSQREKRQLIIDLDHFSCDTAKCASEFDRSFILSAVQDWFGNKEGFEDFVRGPLRKELLSLVPSRYLPLNYVVLILSSHIAWVLNSLISLYKTSADNQAIRNLGLCYLAYYICWQWCAYNSILYLSDRTAQRGSSVTIEWAKTLGVAGAILLWLLLGFALLIAVSRSTNDFAVAGFVVLSTLTWSLQLGALQMCARCFQQQLWSG